jgi:hypothetical protein
LCWISLLSRVRVIVNNLPRNLFLTRVARFVCRTLELVRRGTTPCSFEYAERALLEQERRRLRARRDNEAKLIQATLRSGKTARRISRPVRRAETSTKSRRDPTNAEALKQRSKKAETKATSIHRGRVGAGRADSTFGSMDGTAPCSPGTTDLIVWLRSRKPPYPRPEAL